MEPSAEAQAARAGRCCVCNVVLGRARLQHPVAGASRCGRLRPDGVLDRRRGERVQPHRRTRRARLGNRPHRHPRHGRVAAVRRQARPDALPLRVRRRADRIPPLQLQPRVRLPRRLRLDAHRLPRGDASARDADPELVPRLGRRADARDGRADLRHLARDPAPLDTPRHTEAGEARGVRRRQRPSDVRRPRPSSPPHPALDGAEPAQDGVDTLPDDARRGAVRTRRHDAQVALGRALARGVRRRMRRGFPRHGARRALRRGASPRLVRARQGDGVPPPLGEALRPVLRRLRRRGARHGVLRHALRDAVPRD